MLFLLLIYPVCCRSWNGSQTARRIDCGHYSHRGRYIHRYRGFKDQSDNRFLSVWYSGYFGNHNIDLRVCQIQIPANQGGLRRTLSGGQEYYRLKLMGLRHDHHVRCVLLGGYVVAGVGSKEY